MIKDKSFTIHYQNIQSLIIKIYKVINNLPAENLSNFFVRKTITTIIALNQNCYLPNVNTVFKSQNSISFFVLIRRNYIPIELRKASSYNIFG